jgi:hypothetical protein
MTKGSHLTLTVNCEGRGPCWNCGETGHLHNDCPLPDEKRDSEAFKQDRAEFLKNHHSLGVVIADMVDAVAVVAEVSGAGPQGGSPQVPQSGKWVKPSKSEHNHQMIEVNGALVAHYWDGSTSCWIQEVVQSPMMVPSYVQLSWASNDAASSVTPNTSLAANGMNPQNGNVAQDSLDAAERDAKLVAAQCTLTSAVDEIIRSIKWLLLGPTYMFSCFHVSPSPSNLDAVSLMLGFVETTLPWLSLGSHLLRYLLPGLCLLVSTLWTFTLGLEREMTVGESLFLHLLICMLLLFCTGFICKLQRCKTLHKGFQTDGKFQDCMVWLNEKLVIFCFFVWCRT